MKRTLIIVICLVLGVKNLAHAQRYSTNNKAAIKLYEKARDYLGKRLFDEGIEFLNKAVNKDPNFTEARFDLTRTYLLFKDYDKAAIHAEKLYELAPNKASYTSIYRFLAQDHYLYQGNYEKAKTVAENLLIINPSQYGDIAKRVIQICDYAIEEKKNPVDIQPELLAAPLNKFKTQYFPVLTGDQQTIIFSATTYEANRPPQEDMYISHLEDGKWTQPQAISQVINTPDNEGTCSVSADGKTLVFTYCNNQNLRDSFGGCDLYISTKVGDTWTEPQNLGAYVNSPQKDTQPAVSADGNTIYFSSNRSGSQGDMDLWMSRKDKSGKWQRAVNLGREINTKGKELAPFIHPNGSTLYFSSDGHVENFGQTDIYQSEYDYNTQTWSKPRNLGYPLNDHTYQIALFVTTDGKKGYYTKEDFDPETRIYDSKLYAFDIPPQARPKFKSNYVKGYVYDVQTQEKIEARIDLFDLTANIQQASVNSDPQNGEYLIVLNQGSEYALEVSKKGYAFKSLTFNYSQEENIEPLEINIALEPITKGTSFRLNNIFFDYNKYQLKEKSITELDELVKFMQENESVKGEISGHTDNVGDPKGNQELSLNRAKSIYDYLVKAGIDAKRLTYKGYGAKRPAASNDTEEGRAQNRRIEFEILEIKKQ